MVSKKWPLAVLIEIKVIRLCDPSKLLQNIVEGGLENSLDNMLKTSVVLKPVILAIMLL